MRTVLAILLALGMAVSAWAETFLGVRAIDDVVTFTVNTHDPATGESADADSDPAYRVYEDQTATPILTGTMDPLDPNNSTGFYSKELTLSAANGFEVGKSYTILVRATVNGLEGETTRFVQVDASLSAILADTSELQQEWDTGGGLKLIVDSILAQSTAAADNSANSNLLSTTVDTVTSQTVLVLTEGSNVDDAYNGQQAILTDDSNSDYPSPRNMVLDYDGSTKTVTLATSPNFTVEAGDGIRIALNPKTPLTSDKLSDDRDWVVGQEGNTTGQIVKLNAWSAGERRVSFVWDRFGLSPGTVIDTFNSATVTKVSDSSTVVTTNLRIHQDGRGVNFDIAAISSAARYQVEVSVTTSDDDTFSVRGTLLVE